MRPGKLPPQLGRSVACVEMIDHTPGKLERIAG
jgi:hypothetical protein